MNHVRIINALAYVSDPDRGTDDEPDCFDCDQYAASPLTRESALRAAWELVKVAFRLKTDAQEYAEWEAERARLDAEPSEPITIQGFAGPFSMPGAVAEITFGKKEET